MRNTRAFTTRWPWVTLLTWETFLNNKQSAIISPWKGQWPFIYTNMNPLLLRMLCANLFKSIALDQSAKWFWRRLYIAFIVFSRHFAFISLSKRVLLFIWTHFNLRHPMMICTKFSGNWQVILGKKTLKCIFALQHTPPPFWKNAWPFFWTNLISQYPKVLSTTFGWNWPNDSCEKDENVKSIQTDDAHRRLNKLTSVKVI